MRKIRKFCLLWLSVLSISCSATACEFKLPLDALFGFSSQKTSENESSFSASTEDTSSVSSSAEESSSAEDPALIAQQNLVDLAYTLGKGESLDGIHELTGVIVSVVDEYSASRGNITVVIAVEGREKYPIQCYRLSGTGADTIGVGDSVTVSGVLKNYKGTVEFDKGCTLVAYELANGNQGDDLPDPANDPYADMTASAFYADYAPATSNTDAYYRSLHGFMSGSLTVPDQAPVLSSYQPKKNGAYIRNNEMIFEENGDAYVVVDAYGNEAFTVYRDGAYIALEEVAAFVYAFGTYPANHSPSKNTEPDESVWGEYLRLNHTQFSGDTSRYPYEPKLPNISGCGGTLYYYEMDIGTTGTDCDPSYEVKPYNDGRTITRGAARIVYGKTDLDRDGVFEAGEHYVFYTYNHYNDFQEYLNYAGGWGEKFGNITGGGAISSKYDYNPTAYVEVYIGELSAVNAALLAR